MSENFIPIRLGIQEHLLRGDISLFEFGIYAMIQLQADYGTGIWRGSAARIVATAPRGVSLRDVQRAIRHLADLGMLKPFQRNGARGNYPVLINKYTVRRGALKNQRLNAEKSTSLGSLVYEPCADNDAESDAVPVAESVAEDAPIQEVRRKKPRDNKKTAAPAVPSFVTPSVWNSYVQMRVEIRKPMTPRAMELVFAELERLRTLGHTPDAVLEQSIRNSWQDVYPIREIQSSGKVSSYDEQRRNKTDEALNRYLATHGGNGDRVS
jgi:hypothetical protein